MHNLAHFKVQTKTSPSLSIVPNERNNTYQTITVVTLQPRGKRARNSTPPPPPAYPKIENGDSV